LIDFILNAQQIHGDIIDILAEITKEKIEFNYRER
jgi:hypothetical protein